MTRHKRSLIYQSRDNILFIVYAVIYDFNSSDIFSNSKFCRSYLLLIMANGQCMCRSCWNEGVAKWIAAMDIYTLLQPVQGIPEALRRGTPAQCALLIVYNDRATHRGRDQRTWMKSPLFCTGLIFINFHLKFHLNFLFY